MQRPPIWRLQQKATTSGQEFWEEGRLPRHGLARTSDPGYRAMTSFLVSAPSEVVSVAK